MNAVTRKIIRGDVHDPYQRITPEEALRCYTINGAYVIFEEKTRGSKFPISGPQIKEKGGDMSSESSFGVWLHSGGEACQNLITLGFFHSRPIDAVLHRNYGLVI